MGLRRFNNQRVVDSDSRALSSELLVNIDDDDDDDNSASYEHRITDCVRVEGATLVGPV